MGLLDLFKREKKRVSVINSDDSIGAFTVTSYMGGERKVTREQALSIPTVSYCVDIISSSISQLPFYLYRKNPDGSIEKTDDIRNYLLNGEANPMMTSFNFKKNLVENILFYGASYTVVERLPNSNEIVSLYPLDTEHIEVVKYMDGYKMNAKIKYRNLNADEEFIPEDLLICTKDSEDGITSIGILEKFPELLQLALKEMEYSTSVIDNGGILSGILTAPSKISKVGKENLRESITKVVSGSKNAGKIMVLENGMTYQQISAKPNDLQITQSKQATISELTKMFSMPESLVSSSGNKYGSLEQNNLQFLQYCLSAIIKSMESAFDKSLVLESEKGELFWKCDTTELLRTTEKDRIENVAKAKNEGIISQNEARRKLGEPLLEQDFYLYKIGQCMYDYEKGLVTSLNTGVTIDLENPMTVQQTENPNQQTIQQKDLPNEENVPKEGDKSSRKNSNSKKNNKESNKKIDKKATTKKNGGSKNNNKKGVEKDE